MTGPYTFKRFDVTGALDQWTTPPGHWCAWRGKAHGKEGYVEKLFVVICCPLCKKQGTLPHAVDAKGRVTPSVGCPHVPCPFHTMPVTLEGWDWGERKDEGD